MGKQNCEKHEEHDQACEECRKAERARVRRLLAEGEVLIKEASPETDRDPVKV